MATFGQPSQVVFETTMVSSLCLVMCVWSHAMCVVLQGNITISHVCMVSCHVCGIAG